MTEPSTQLSAVINGITISRTVPNRMILSDFLRYEIGLTGTKVSCDLQVCGVCSVLIDGTPVSSCTYLAADIDGKTVETVEGLGTKEDLHPLQKAFVDHFALQCGFCTPGFLMMSKELLARNPNPTQEEIVHHLEGNICRCTGYRPIIEAIMSLAVVPEDNGAEKTDADRNADGQ